MSKKLTFKTKNEVLRAVGALKDFHIKHVVVTYKHKDHDEMFIVVLNKDLAEAKTAIEMAEIPMPSIKNRRHFEKLAIKQSYYEPKFDCVCRGCGKTFKSIVKEAKWCCASCKQAFRKRKAQQQPDSPTNG